MLSPDFPSHSSSPQSGSLPSPTSPNEPPRPLVQDLALADWQTQLRASATTPTELAHWGLISTEEARQTEALSERFKIRLTPYYASLMEPNDPKCPIRLQAIPQLSETDPELPDWAVALSQTLYGRPVPWSPDPIGDLAKQAAPRLTHRYGNRAILHLSSLCAMYCRFCFRKSHLNDAERTLYDGSLDPALDYIVRTPTLHELILTGGDPLSLSDAALERLFERLVAIPHLRVVRVHSRMAVTLPQRLTSGLAAVFERALRQPRSAAPARLRIHLVSHFNHPKELTPSALAALARMSDAGVTLFNQSVLLRGINNQTEILAELFQQLYENSVRPFYLHHADWTPGTFAFRTSIEESRQLARSLIGLLPGAALPHLVLDIPGGIGKTPLLDGRVIREQNWSSGGVAGALYRVPVPVTRSHASEPDASESTTPYLDLWQEPSPHDRSPSFSASLGVHR
jgi:lysine 2,3-aminomutase